MEDKMNNLVSECKNVAELFTRIQSELAKTDTELGDILGISPKYLPQIRKEGGKIPSDTVMLAFAKHFNVRFEDCVELRIRSLRERKEKEEQHHISNTNEENEANSTESSLAPIKTTSVDTPFNYDVQQANVIQKLNPGYPEQMGEINDVNNKETNKRKLLECYIKHLESFSFEILEEYVPVAYQNLDILIGSKQKRVTHSEFNKMIINIKHKWDELCKKPKYNTDPHGEFKVDFSGVLELSNEKVPLTLTADKRHICITTRAQDKNHIQEFIRTVPGMLTKEDGYGNLGSIFHNTPVYHVRIFNAGPLKLEIEAQLTALNVPMTKLVFESNQIESLFN
ncbi:hypothetical protein [Bacillus sp. MUM 13]|uniref:hypothetical protein n=1 Tax=Bacillus sp. MUM 13 TaxID=1678001 RepID=UPI0008F59E0E|nr:hypothetical protein [Bacillus sp. MUM 13]OIK10070.1 hypothetical protein BIV59_15150 [Bacillus sp. MUM 13]